MRKLSRRYLNLTSASWRQLRRNWNLPLSPMWLWQTFIPGMMFSLMGAVQNTVSGKQLEKADLRGAIVILGYWRSGTTLLHELLCLDTRYTYPTTHACMNPHHFLFTEAAVVARGGARMQRPMDEMEIRSDSPQEDEFAFLSLGARSPYEALLIPGVLQQALQLSDPRGLPAEDEKRWCNVFLTFLRSVSACGGGRRVILKSPTHGERVSILREFLPDARYILISRDPMTNFESVVRMWTKMFESYAITDCPHEDAIREAVLRHRPCFEEKLAAGTAGLPGNRFISIAYESLVENPIQVIEAIYERLDLGEFEPVRNILTAELERRRGYKPQARLPSVLWQERIHREWAAVITQHVGLRARPAFSV